jgi:hypothetical protein
MKISNEKHWERQIEQIEKSGKVVMYYNENIFLSLSKPALVEKANQIKEDWLEKQYNNITKIANIEIRR